MEGKTQRTPEKTEKFKFAYESVPDLERNVSLMQVEVESYMFDMDKSNKKFANYIIQCRYTKNIKWEVKRRYKQFERLAEQLTRSFINMPRLPGKTLLPVTEDTKVEKRREALQSYLQHLIHREELYSHPYFYNFLALPLYVPFLMINSPIPLGGIWNNKSLGYRDCHLSIEGEFAIVASHELFVTNRVDSYFSNLFSRKTAPHQQAEVTKTTEKFVGLVEFLRRVDRGQTLEIVYPSKGSPKSPAREIQLDEIRPIQAADPVSDKVGDRTEEDSSLGYFNYQKVFDKAFKFQVISMAWSSELQLLSVGLDSGDIFVYGYDVGDLTAFNRETPFIQAHDKRVMKMSFDDKKACLYSIGEDRRLVSLDLLESTVSNKFVLPSAKPTNMAYCKRYQMAAVSDKDAAVYFISLSKKMPEVFQKVNTQMKGPIRGLYLAFEKGIFLAASHADGLIKGFRNPSLGDKTGQFTCILMIQSTPGVRCFSYWEERQELWVGYSKGVVKVYGGVSFDDLSVKDVTSARTTATFSAPLHTDDITELKILTEQKIFITVSKDMSVRIWSPPEFWKRAIKGRATEDCKYEHDIEYFSDGDSSTGPNTSEQQKYQENPEDED